MKNYKDNQSNKGSPLDSSSSFSSSSTQFSHGQTNNEDDHDHDHHHHHQMVHHDDGHNHHHIMPKNPSDEDPQSSSELLEVELSKQFDSLEEVDKPDMIVLPSVASPIRDHLEELNKPDMIISSSTISSVGDYQTPLESDLEFWNRLDGIEAFFSNDEVDELLDGVGSNQSLNCQNHVCHNNNKNKNFEEVDSNNWLRYLEHELGLEDTGGDEILINRENPRPLIPSESCNDQIMKISTEDNMGMGYFHHQQLIAPESCDQIMDNIPTGVDMGMGYFHHHHHHHAWPSYQSPRHSSVF